MENFKSAEESSGGFFEFMYGFALAFMKCTHYYSFVYIPPVLLRLTASRMLINVIRIEDGSICRRNMLRI